MYVPSFIYKVCMHLKPLFYVNCTVHVQHIQYNYLIRRLSSDTRPSPWEKKNLRNFLRSRSVIMISRLSSVHHAAQARYFQTEIISVSIFVIVSSYINTANTVSWLACLLLRTRFGLKWNLVSFFVSPYSRVLVGGLDVCGSTGWK